MVLANYFGVSLDRKLDFKVYITSKISKACKALVLKRERFVGIWERDSTRDLCIYANLANFNPTKL